jgi:hypothetical protein
MKKQVTIQLKVMLDIEVDVKQGETLQEAVDSITQDMDYSFTECEQADGSIINTEIVAEEIITETDIS